MSALIYACIAISSLPSASVQQARNKPCRGSGACQEEGFSHQTVVGVERDACCVSSLLERQWDGHPDLSCLLLDESVIGRGSDRETGAGQEEGLGADARHLPKTARDTEHFQRRTVSRMVGRVSGSDVDQRQT